MPRNVERLPIPLCHAVNCSKLRRLIAGLAWNMTRRRRTVHGLGGAMTLLRRHLAPLLAQLHASFRRHLPEPIEGFAHLLLPLRRQRPELLPALTEQLPLIRRHGAPL
jgi:hypothetical protein